MRRNLMLVTVGAKRVTSLYVISLLIFPFDAMNYIKTDASSSIESSKQQYKPLWDSG